MIKIVNLALILTVSLYGRLNPFETEVVNTPKNVEIQESVIVKKLEPIAVKEPLKSIDDGERTVKLEGTDTSKILIKKVVKKEIIEKQKIVKIKPTKKEIEAICKVLPKKEIKDKEIINPIYIKEKTKVIRHKISKNDDFVPTTYKILPFVTIDTDFEHLKITSRPKYNIVTYHVLKEKNKIAFDFLADVWFYTRYKKLDAPYFDSYTLGNHKNKKFFRVTISLKENVKNYRVQINNHIAKIIHIK